MQTNIFKDSKIQRKRRERNQQSSSVPSKPGPQLLASLMMQSQNPVNPFQLFPHPTIKSIKTMNKQHQFPNPTIKHHKNIAFNHHSSHKTQFKTPKTKKTPTNQNLQSPNPKNKTRTHHKIKIRSKSQTQHPKNKTKPKKNNRKHTEATGAGTGGDKTAPRISAASFFPKSSSVIEAFGEPTVPFFSSITNTQKTKDQNLKERGKGGGEEDHT